MLLGAVEEGGNSIIHVMKNGETGEIGYRQWCAPEPKAVLLLVHGVGTHSGRWEAMADFFQKKGISSYAIELRDLKATDKTGDRRDSFGSYYSKILHLYDIAAKENPKKNIFLVGESLGAVVSFLLCVARPGLFRGLICISPAFATRNKLSPLDCIRMLTPLFYDPEKLFFLPFDSSMCTRDNDYRKKLDQDPYEYRSVSSRMIFDILLAQIRAKKVKNKMSTPALFLIAGEDKIVDAAQARAIFKGLAVKDKALVEFPGMYHSLSIDLGKEAVFEEILKWAEKKISA